MKLKKIETSTRLHLGKINECHLNLGLFFYWTFSLHLPFPSNFRGKLLVFGGGEKYHFEPTKNLWFGSDDFPFQLGVIFFSGLGIFPLGIGVIPIGMWVIEKNHARGNGKQHCF